MMSSVGRTSICNGADFSPVPPTIASARMKRQCRRPRARTAETSRIDPPSLSQTRPSLALADRGTRSSTWCSPVPPLTSSLASNAAPERSMPREPSGLNRTEPRRSVRPHLAAESEIRRGWPAPSNAASPLISSPPSPLTAKRGIATIPPAPILRVASAAAAAPAGFDQLSPGNRNWAGVQIGLDDRLAAATIAERGHRHHERHRAEHVQPGDHPREVPRPPRAPGTAAERRQGERARDRTGTSPRSPVARRGGPRWPRTGAAPARRWW